MGLFNKKKISAEDMAMQMMHASVEVTGKLRCFDSVDNSRTMEVSIGYFYGFLRLHLNGITSLDIADTIIRKSIDALEYAVKGQPSFDNFGYSVRTIANTASANLRYAMKDLKDNPFMGMAIFYLNDLHNSTSIDISESEDAEYNMRFLYGAIYNLIKDVKITK